MFYFSKKMIVKIINDFAPTVNDFSLLEKTIFDYYSFWKVNGNFSVFVVLIILVFKNQMNVTIHSHYFFSLKNSFQIFSFVHYIFDGQSSCSFNKTLLKKTVVLDRVRENHSSFSFWNSIFEKSLHKKPTLVNDSAKTMLFFLEKSSFKNLYFILFLLFDIGLDQYGGCLWVVEFFRNSIGIKYRDIFFIVNMTDVIIFWLYVVDWNCLKQRNIICLDKYRTFFTFCDLRFKFVLNQTLIVILNQ